MVNLLWSSVLARSGAAADGLVARRTAPGDVRTVAWGSGMVNRMRQCLRRLPEWLSASRTYRYSASRLRPRAPHRPDEVSSPPAASGPSPRWHGRARAARLGREPDPADLPRFGEDPMRRLNALLVGLLCSFVVPATAATAPREAPAPQRIRAADLMKTVEWLASPPLHGRLAGGPGYMEAAREHGGALPPARPGRGRRGRLLPAARRRVRGDGLLRPRAGGRRRHGAPVRASARTSSAAA